MTVSENQNNQNKDIPEEEKPMARPRTEKGPQKDLRIVLSAEAHERIVKQSRLLDQTPASFARQVIMERVTALEAAGSQGSAINMMRELFEKDKKAEEKL